MAIRHLVILGAVLLFLAAPRPADPSVTYQVRRGDTLSKIAKRFHVPPRQIREANRMRTSQVVAGETLRIPGKSSAKRAGNRVVKRPGKRAGKRVAKGSAQGAAQLHTVRRGDTLGSISRRYGVSVEELRRQNLLKRGKRLRAGTQIVVRAGVPEPAREPALPGVETEEEAPNPARVTASAQPPVITEEELHEAARPLPAAQDNAAESPRQRVIRVARKMLFTPYLWGGTSLAGIDCSGYVRKVFAFLDLDLPRSAREQFRVGQEVEKDCLSIGDLVFFRTYAKYPSHVGIYLGNNRFIHASSGSRQVKISSMDHPYFVKRYIGAKRLLFEENDVLN